MISRDRDYISINLLVYLSLAIFILTKLGLEALTIEYMDFRLSQGFYLAVSLAASYLPFFAYNNFTINYSAQPKRKLEIKEYFYFTFIILFFNVISYFFTMGLDRGFNNLQLTVYNPNMEFTGVSSPIWMFIYSIILAPIIEELIYRDFILRKLEKYGSGLAILVSTTLFALMHGNLSQILSSFLLGLVLAFVYSLTKSKKAVIILHIVNNAYIFLYNVAINENIIRPGIIQTILFIEFIVYGLLFIYSLTNLINDRRNYDIIHINKFENEGNIKAYFFNITSIILLLIFIVQILMTVRAI